MTSTASPRDAGDPHAVNADLHSHSNYSDGTLAPAALVQRAKKNGVELFALTDHDVLSGLTEAADAAADLGLNFVAGVEISVTWGGETIHIVGLRIDHQAPVLVDGLARIRAGRDQRARAMGLQSIFVLTTRTMHWFIKRGFVQMDPDWLPEGRKRKYNWDRRSQVLVKKLS